MRARGPGPIVLFGVALALRLGWMGRWGALHAGVEPANLRSVRRVFDGHERLFFEAFRGSVADPTAQAWPLGLWVHRGLGLLVSDPRWLLVLPSLAGAVAVVLVAALTSRHFGRRAGAWAGVLAAVLPEHVAWSTSAVPVVLATTLMLWSFWVRSDWGAAVLLGLAAALRPELAVWGLCRGWAGLAGLLVGGLTWSGSAHHPRAALGRHGRSTYCWWTLWRLGWCCLRRPLPPGVLGGCSLGLRPALPGWRCSRIWDRDTCCFPAWRCVDWRAQPWPGDLRLWGWRCSDWCSLLPKTCGRTGMCGTRRLCLMMF